jgi:hypothetical protein
MASITLASEAVLKVAARNTRFPCSASGVAQAGCRRNATIVGNTGNLEQDRRLISPQSRLISFGRSSFSSPSGRPVLTCYGHAVPATCSVDSRKDHGAMYLL